VVSEAISILDEVRRGGYDFCFAATYNAYLPFYEQVILPRLATAGCRANVLMMDARQCATALSEESTRPRLAGRAYTLMPVKAGGAFHPKIILLIGRHKGLLFIGSHNLTLSGLSHNRELTNRFEVASDKDHSEMAAIKTSWDFMRAWSAEQPLELQEAFNSAERSAKWLRDADTQEAESMVYGSLPEGASLWEMVLARVPSNVKRITAVAPYFDNKLDFLQALNNEFTPKEFVVGIDTEIVQINKDARQMMSAARFVDATCLREERGYLHAKALLFETTDGQELLVTGSANASSPAWLAAAKERNAEIVVLRSSSKRQSVAAALGLKKLHTQPRLTDEAWNSIQRRRAPASSTSTYQVPLVAVETEDGFEIYTKSVKDALLPQVTLVNTSGDQIGVYDAAGAEPRLLTIEVPEAEIRRQASLISLQTASGKSIFATIHHTFNVPVSAQTEKQKQLRIALDSLSGDAPMFDEMFKLVERVVFDEPSDDREAPKGGRKGDKSIPQEPPAEQTVFASSLKDRRAARLRERFASSGDLGLLLDALNRRLGIGLEAEVTSTVGVARSEEDIIGSDDEELASSGEIDEVEIARTCQRKTARMMRRMTAQLERAGALKDTAFVAVSQLAAVLGVLQLLRELEWKRVRSLRGETYILYREERRFFLDATRLLYARRSAIMEYARAVHEADNMPAEIGTALGLLFWLAYDIGIDLRYEFDQEDRKEREISVREMARLLAMAPQLCGDDFTEQKARDAIIRFSAYEEEEGAAEEWYEEHLEWMKMFAELHRKPQDFSTVRRMPEPGDLSYLTRAINHQPFVVLDSDGTSVKVVDLDKEGEEKNYGIYNIDYIAVINAE
jgi:HKD family nuclease